jgi:CheY-specific phosphatase CheX
MDEARLSALTLRFAECVRDCFRDMLGIEIAIRDDAVQIADFAPAYSTVVLIHFTGPMQGDYALSLDETTAARLIGAWSEGMAGSDLRALRADFGGMLKEFLNTAVGMAIPSLEEIVGRLTYHPPMIVYGELDTPSIPSGNLVLEADAGPIACSLVLDAAGTDAERMLLQAVADLRKARREVETCTRVLADMLEQSRVGSLPPVVLDEAERVLGEMRVSIDAGDSFT